MDIKLNQQQEVNPDFFDPEKLHAGYAQKYYNETRKISHSSSFSQTQMNAQRLREHAQMYLNCSL